MYKKQCQNFPTEDEIIIVYNHYFIRLLTTPLGWIGRKEIERDRELKGEKGGEQRIEPKEINNKYALTINLWN